jgi:hypothetical protein
MHSVTRLHKIYLGIVAVLIVAALIAGISYKISVVRAEEQQKATDKVLAAKDQALADRDKQFSAFRDDMLRQISDLKTAKQASQVLAPIIVPAGGMAPQTVTKAELPPEVSKTLPGPPNASFTLLTDEQMIKLGQRELTCQVTEAGLTKCAADKADMQAKIDALTKANNDWKKAGAVGPWMFGLGASRDAGGKGYSSNFYIQRRLNSSLGIMAGVQGKGDVSLALTWNFGEKK